MKAAHFIPPTFLKLPPQILLVLMLKIEKKMQTGRHSDHCIGRNSNIEYQSQLYLGAKDYILPMRAEFLSYGKFYCFRVISFIFFLFIYLCMSINLYYWFN